MNGWGFAVYRVSERDGRLAVAFAGRVSGRAGVVIFAADTQLALLTWDESGFPLLAD
jgi:hypothetical protein